MQTNKARASIRLAEELATYAGTCGVVLVSPRNGISSGLTVGRELQMPVDLLFENQVPLKGQVVIIVQDEITNEYILGRLIDSIQKQGAEKVVVAALAATQKAAAVLSYAADETVVLEIIDQELEMGRITDQ